MDENKHPEKEPEPRRAVRFPSTRGTTRPATGRRGEHLAAAHLRNRGYEVIARNVRTAAGEIDVIARRGATIVFVEVKTARIPRANGLPLPPEPRPLESLRHRQLRRIRRAAALWLQGEGAAAASPAGGSAPTIRFDAIGIVLDCRWELRTLDHIEAAW